MSYWTVRLAVLMVAAGRLCLERQRERLSSVPSSASVLQRPENVPEPAEGTNPRATLPSTVLFPRLARL
jgi:hypothetical protein